MDSDCYRDKQASIHPKSFPVARPLPLTPALSPGAPGERETVRPFFVKLEILRPLDTLRFIRDRNPWLPLPRERAGVRGKSLSTQPGSCHEIFFATVLII